MLIRIIQKADTLNEFTALAQVCRLFRELCQKHDAYQGPPPSIDFLKSKNLARLEAWKLAFRVEQGLTQLPSDQKPVFSVQKSRDYRTGRVLPFAISGSLFATATGAEGKTVSIQNIGDIHSRPEVMECEASISQMRFIELEGRKLLAILYTYRHSADVFEIQEANSPKKLGRSDNPSLFLDLPTLNFGASGEGILSTQGSLLIIAYKDQVVIEDFGKDMDHPDRMTLPIPGVKKITTSSKYLVLLTKNDCYVYLFDDITSEPSNYHIKIETARVIKFGFVKDDLLVIAYRNDQITDRERGVQVGEVWDLRQCKRIKNLLVEDTGYPSYEINNVRKTDSILVAGCSTVRLANGDSSEIVSWDLSNPELNTTSKNKSKCQSSVPIFYIEPLPSSALFYTTLCGMGILYKDQESPEFKSLKLRQTKDSHILSSLLHHQYLILQTYENEETVLSVYDLAPPPNPQD